MAPFEKSWSRNLRFGTGRLLLLSWSLLFASASSRLVNITVDDTFGDPTTDLFPEYLPNNGTWNAGSSSEDCPTCFIGPSTLNLTQIHNGTWHDTTYLPSEALATITVRFNGSAVYVYNILPNTLPSTITLANISFSVDGEYVDRFIRAPDSGSTILYNQLVYHNTTLNDGPHSLTMTAGDNSLVLFDYLIYTTEGNDTSPSPNDASQSSSSSTPAGAIVGAVIGGVVLLGAVIGGLFLYRKHKRSNATQTAVRAYMEDSTSGGSERKYPVGEDHTYSPPPPTPVTPTSPAEPIVRSLGAPIAYLPSVLEPGDVSGIEAQSSRSPIIAGAPSPSTADWSLRRRAELTQRLEALQRTRSVLSSQAPSSLLSRLETSTISETRTEVAIRELEAEMAQLRGVLSTLNARLAEGHGGHLDPLPEYEE
uniref:Siderophore exporter MmpL4 n=1 Tax=Ganoderma boninense TaxID=34458 RepID=A0A5K1K0K9_9APHY|nr:Siderophore exporter MmpL4 [Ganoderma boninense]